MLKFSYMAEYKISNKNYRLLVFWIGIAATFAYRVIVVLNHYSAFWVEVAWHIGTIGFIWYFAHRFRVENNREKIIAERKLIYKIHRQKNLSEEDREALKYVLKSLRSSKAKWNYVAIFFFSAIALLYALIMDIVNLL